MVTTVPFQTTRSCPEGWLTLTSTLNSAYNKKNVEILLCYRQLFVKGDIIIDEWGIFGVEIFLHYSQFFIKGNFIIGRVESTTVNGIYIHMIY